MNLNRRIIIKTRIVSILLIAIIMILITALILNIWHRTKLNSLSNDFPPEIRFVEVDGERIAYYTCEGGNHTVVFLAGWGTPSPYVDFISLMESLPEQASGLIVERFGYGNSDDTKRERSVENIVQELEMVLMDSELQPPYVFVAHSLASIEVLGYAIKNEEKVGGIVLVDAGNPEVYATVKPIVLIPKLQRLISIIGINRLLIEVNNDFQSLISEQNNYSLSAWDTKERIKNISWIKAKIIDKFPTIAMVNELKMSQKNAERLIESRRIFDFPIICFTSDLFGKQTDVWIQSQKDLKSWSKNYTWDLITESGHYVHHYQPQKILTAIQSLIENSND